MVLAYLESPVTENKVGELFEAAEFGVPSSRIIHLEKWGYQVIYRSASLSELQQWIGQGQPVIAFVYTRFLDYWTAVTPHAVVIIGIDNENVYLNDPAFEIAPQTCSINGFLAAWVEMDEVTALIEKP
jgi:ABC-type bacteriocin/lantibiotic exporter with double-glycine peptidase domain